MKNFKPMDSKEISKVVDYLYENLPLVVHVSAEILKGDWDSTAQRIGVDIDPPEVDQVLAYTMLRELVPCELTLSFNWQILTPSEVLTLELAFLRNKLVKTPTILCSKVNKEIKEVEAEIRMHERTG